MGLRLRLKASFDISIHPPEVQVILRALKKYGLIVADNGTDAAWPSTLDIDGEATIMIYFDVPTDFGATAVKIMGREFSLS